jgi:hypothetical protein
MVNLAARVLFGCLQAPKFGRHRSSRKQRLARRRGWLTTTGQPGSCHPPNSPPSASPLTAPAQWQSESSFSLHFAGELRAPSFSLGLVNCFTPFLAASILDRRTFPPWPPSVPCRHTMSTLTLTGTRRAQHCQQSVQYLFFVSAILLTATQRLSPEIAMLAPCPPSSPLGTSLPDPPMAAPSP